MSDLDLGKDELVRLISALAWRGHPKRQPVADRRLVGKLHRHMAKLGMHETHVERSLRGQSLSYRALCLTCDWESEHARLLEHIARQDARDHDKQMRKEAQTT
jgi:hypothetical protein